MQKSVATSRKRKKACRRDTERAINALGLPPRSTEPIIDGDEATRLWLAERCFACRRCPAMVTRLALWKAGVVEE